MQAVAGVQREEVPCQGRAGRNPVPMSQWLCVFLPLLITVCISIACVVDQDFIVQIITLLARLVIFTDQMVLYVARAERRAMVEGTGDVCLISVLQCSVAVLGNLRLATQSEC